MLRAFLVIAIAAGIGTICLVTLKVAPKIDGLEGQVTDLSSQLTTARNNEREATAKMEEAEAKADQLRGALAQTEDDLETAKVQLRTQQRRADGLDSDLAAANTRLAQVDRALNRYIATGVSVEDIQTMDQRIRDITEERDVFVAENTVLARKVRDLEAEILHYFGPPSYEVELPEGLNGNVVAVNDQWGFVVMDIGQEDGVLEKGRLLVSRDGKLVAKVQVSSVEPGRSIANVLPEWQQAKIEAGDQVLY